MSNIDLFKDDLELAKYKDRFANSKTKKFKKIGILTVSFFDVDINTNLNYIYKKELCYLKYIKSNLKGNLVQYEVRKIC